MKYKWAYRPYTVSRLVQDARGGRGTTLGGSIGADWSEELNRYAKEGWVVRNSGTIDGGIEVVVWALLEKD